MAEKPDMGVTTLEKGVEKSPYGGQRTSWKAASSSPCLFLSPIPTANLDHISPRAFSKPL